MIRIGDMVGTHDIVWVTLDSLRFDVARDAHASGLTPTFAGLFPAGWEERHTPGSFTYPAHQAFFGGFLPTRPGDNRPAQPFCGEFDAAVGVRDGSFVFGEPSVPQALAARGYRTVCLGGVGFFSGRGALGSHFPALFQQWRWRRASGPQSVHSARVQADWVIEELAATPADQRLFCFWNVAATHTPTHLYVPDVRRDSVDTQAAALAAVDAEFARVLPHLRRPTALFVFSDHGDCFGEDGARGHGIAHPLVWTVPYADVELT